MHIHIRTHSGVSSIVTIAISHTPPRYFQKVPTFEVAKVDSEDQRSMHRLKKGVER